MKNKFSTLNSQLSTHQGFTLIELLIVIVVIGVLATGAIALVDPVAQFQRARDAQRKSDLSQIQKAIKQYYQDIGAYPQSTVGYKIKALGSENAVDWGNSWLPYMGNLPKDPNDSKSYIYVSTGQAYYIYASLDRGANDRQACKGGAKCDNVPGSETCGGICDYGVSSPNVSP